MKLYRLFLAAAVVALLTALPITATLRNRTNQLKQEQVQKTKLQEDVKNVQQQLDDQRRQNADLQKQLQVKADLTEQAKQATVAVSQPQPPFAAVVAPSAGPGNCEAYRPIVAQYGWDVSIALAVMHAESGCRPDAVSPTCDHGLMQINCVHSAKVGGNLALLNDPATNIRIAFDVYTGAHGWSPWTTFASGAYRKFL